MKNKKVMITMIKKAGVEILNKFIYCKDQKVN